jgi:RecB family exonuclease
MPDGSFLIVDWKTGKAQRRGLLAMRMLTLVYPYVLARAGGGLNDNKPIPPEQIKMVYWFAEASETVEFSSNAEKLRVDEDQLMSIIGEISARFEFPLTHELRQCRFCPYRSLCERGERAGDLQELIADGEEDDSGKITFDLDDIEEVSF